MDLTDSININAPIERVFESVADREEQKLWIDGLVDVELTSEWNEHNPIGTQFKQRLVKGRKQEEYEFEGEILAYEKPELYGIRIGNADFTAEIYYRLEEVAGGTRLNYETHMEFSGNMIARFIGRMAAHHTKQDMQKLVALAEGR